MLIVIGLLILAVLLFGSSAVIGTLGAILGFFVACGALAYSAYLLASFFEVSIELGIGLTIGVPLAILLVYGLIMELKGLDPATGKKRRR